MLIVMARSLRIFSSKSKIFTKQHTVHRRHIAVMADCATTTTSSSSPLSQPKRTVTLWVGGSSSLARTFVNVYGQSRVGGEDEKNKNGENVLLLSGKEPNAPDWVQTNSIAYVGCDLTKLTEYDARTKLLDNPKYGKVTQIIIGIRPVLFAAYTTPPTNHKNNNAKQQAPATNNGMIKGIETLLRCAAAISEQEKARGGKYGVSLVLHLSSVAAAHHLRPQSFVSEDDPIPPLSEYTATYDIFKRQCEIVISNICKEATIPYCHLRLSAIFSDDSKCIQCSALGLQARVGCYLPMPIDCNSSRNVSRAISVILDQSIKDSTKIQSLYYYTRPLHLKRPVPYGYYLQAFRKAHDMERYSIWIPVWIVTWFVAFFHRVAQWNDASSSSLQLPYISSADYLLQVAAREHSFDCSRFAKDFPNLEEETILECFIRRRQFLMSKRPKIKTIKSI